MPRLRDLRKARGFSQRQMQNLTGIKQSNYSEIENGKRGLSLNRCVRIALALDASIDYLIGRTDDPTPYRRSQRFLPESSE